MSEHFKHHFGIRALESLLRSRRPFGTSKAVDAKTQKIHARLMFLITLPRSCHVASTSVAVWAQTLAQIGYRKQLTISIPDPADRRRQITRT